MMRDAILAFAQQFSYQPQIENQPNLAKKPHVLVLGMGGSHLAADLLKLEAPELQIQTYSDYGLPFLPKSAVEDTLIIASSYSGNTEETIDGLNAAIKQGFKTAVISVGGRLIEIAKTNNLPYVQLPSTGIQPRSALGFSLLGLADLVGYTLDGFHTLTDLKPTELELPGQLLAQTLVDRIPVIYASNRNQSLAYNWKIKMNETGKIPACYNLFPELNHNEMTGFDVKKSTLQLSNRCAFIMLSDTNDHPKIQQRMKIVSDLYTQRGLEVIEQPLSGATRWERICNSLLLADWTAVSIAAHYGLESEQVPMVEEFKKIIAGSTS